MNSLQEPPVKTIETKKGKRLPVVYKDAKWERPSGINKSDKKNVGGLASLEKKTPPFEQRPSIRFDRKNSLSLNQFINEIKPKKKAAQNAAPKNYPPPKTWQILEPATCQPDLKEIMRQQKFINRHQSKSLTSLTTIDEPIIVKSPKKIAKNQQLIEDLLHLWKFHDISINSVYEHKEIDVLSKDVHCIEKFFNTNMKSCILTSIKRVVNPYLLLSYNLKKATNNRYQEQLLFHGTKIENVDSICIDNFDWRMNYKHKYGKGVSFSTTPWYAKYYTDPSGNHKVMFAVKTLIGLALPGQFNHEVPQEPFDTTTDGKGLVYVKYDDSSFYPEYIINYQEKSSI